jgi:amidase
MQVNPDAFAIAAERDAERAKGEVRGPLHGIPFTVKDNIATKDSLETTAGSWALLGNVVPRDAHVVKKLREAGAVLFGKAALSEWADMRSNDYSEGYSARGGQVRSAYNLTVNPGGSSSGSGVGVGANVIAFSLGTETDGSGEFIRAPKYHVLNLTFFFSYQPCQPQRPGRVQAHRWSDFPCRRHS